jgi:3D (Asp-Asp-Asp) domain-containing protein
MKYWFWFAMVMTGTLFGFLLGDMSKQAYTRLPTRIEKTEERLLALQREFNEYKALIAANLHNESTREVEFDVVEMNVSAYCPCKLCCQEFADGITATGSDAKKRGVAVDPKLIPYGSKLFVPGYGYAIADDCGGAIKGKRLDVRMTTHQEALEWGRQTLRVRVYR